jgi:hypothetical protein
MASKRSAYHGLEVRIGPHVVTIAERPLENEYGLFEERPYRVSVTPGLVPMERASTVIHELIHACEAVYGITLGESKVRALESAIVLAVTQNPDLIRLLAADLQP